MSQASHNFVRIGQRVSMKLRVLLIDDSETIQLAISAMLTSGNFLLTTAPTGAEGLLQIAQHPFDVVLLDYGLPDMDGLAVLQHILQEKPDLPVIIVTGSGSERIAVNALKSGAADYIIKSDDFVSKLPHIIQDAVEKCEIKRRNRDLEGQLRESYKQLKQLNAELEEKVQTRTEELERAYQLSNELMAKAVDSNMQLAELYSEVDESRRKLDTKIRELALLNDIGKKMTATLEQDTLLHVALESLHQELEIDHCALLLCDDDQAHLLIGASRGTPDDLLLAAKAVNGESILRDILRKGEPVLIQDIEGDARLAGMVKDFPDLDSCMLVPLRAKQFELGLITVYGYANRATFTKENLAFVSALAGQTSISLANIRLTHQHVQDEQVEFFEQMTQELQQLLLPLLDTIQASAERIRRENPDTTARQQIAEAILSANSQIHGVIQDLRECSSGKRGTLHVQMLNVGEFIHTLVGKLAPRFAQQRISIQTALEYPGALSMDAEKMTRAFIMLAEHARAAMPGGGSLTISSRVQNDRVYVEFTDTGDGMSMEQQASLLDPMNFGLKAYHTGLGMIIAKKILDEHHARIEVSSILNKGTTIRVVFPRAQSADPDNRPVVNGAVV